MTMGRVLWRAELPMEAKRLIELALVGGYAVGVAYEWKWLLWDGRNRYFRVYEDVDRIVVEEIEPDCRVRILFEGDVCDPGDD